MFPPVGNGGEQAFPFSVAANRPGIFWQEPAGFSVNNGFALKTETAWLYHSELAAGWGHIVVLMEQNGTRKPENPFFRAGIRPFQGYGRSGSSGDASPEGKTG